MANLHSFNKRHEHFAINSELIVRAVLIETESKLFNKRRQDVRCTPATVAAPTRSLFQTNSVAVKNIWEISWAKLRTHAVQQLTGVAW
jgi:hypothetical protein